MTVKLLSRVLDYFLNPEHAWMFGRDIHRALTEFSGGTGPINEDSYEYFLDWFLFNFQYRDAETPLAYVCRTNPLKVSDEELELLRIIAEKNRFGYFEVTATSRSGMTLISVKDGDEYTIVERIADAKPEAGEVMLCRIAPVNGEWRILNSSALALRPSKHDWERIRSHPVRDSREAYHEILREGMKPQISALELGEGKALISAGGQGWSPDEDDDCPICRVMRKAKEEQRQPLRAELERAFREVNASKNKKRH